MTVAPPTSQLTTSAIEAKSRPALDGAALFFLDPSDISKRSSYLLFLVLERDGRLAPTGGQTDPGYKAISPLPFEPNQANQRLLFQSNELPSTWWLLNRRRFLRHNAR
jgi:hypothetical protein